MAKAKTSQQLRKEALTKLQKLVRLKAADDNGYVSCVSCGVTRQWNDRMQGGHYLAKGGSSRWALEEVNVHPQCASCNCWGMSGGSASQQYTLYMIDMYGRDFVEEMIRTKSDGIKWYKQDYVDFIDELNSQIKEQEERLGL